MSKTSIYAVVTARLVLVGIALIIRWAIFEPIYFIFTLLTTLTDSLTSLFNYILSQTKEFINWATASNEQLLNNESIKANK